MASDEGALTIEETARALGVTIEQLQALLRRSAGIEGQGEPGGRAASDQVERPLEPPARGEWDRLLSPAQVGKLFGVKGKTVSTWAVSGRLPSVRTPGGHRRFWESDVRRLLESNARDRSGVR